MNDRSGLEVAAVVECDGERSELTDRLIRRHEHDNSDHIHGLYDKSD